MFGNRIDADSGEVLNFFIPYLKSKGGLLC